MLKDFFREYTGVTRFKVLPGTTPLVAMALIDMAVSIVCRGKGENMISMEKDHILFNAYLYRDEYVA